VNRPRMSRLVRGERVVASRRDDDEDDARRPDVSDRPAADLSSRRAFIKRIKFPCTLRCVLGSFLLQETELTLNTRRVFCYRKVATQSFLLLKATRHQLTVTLNQYYNFPLNNISVVTHVVHNNNITTTSLSRKL